jgi:hypothetical protein
MTYIFKTKTIDKDIHLNTFYRNCPLQHYSVGGVFCVIRRRFKRIFV